MDPDEQLNPQQAAMTMKVIWAALLMGVLIIAVVFAGVIVPFHDPEAETGIWLTVAIVLTGGGVIASFAARKLLIKQVWKGGRFDMPAYATASIVPLAILDGVAVLILVFTVIVRSFMPLGVLALIVLGFMALHFPKSPERLQSEMPSDAADRR